MSITALPSAPLITDPPNTFNSKAFAWVAALDTFTTETNAQATAVNADKVSADADAASAAASANSAAASAGVVKWVSGTTYAQGACVWSPANFQTYRRKTASGSGTTDPSADTTNYAAISGDLSAGVTIGTPTLNTPTIVTPQHSGTSDFNNTALIEVKTITLNSQLTLATTSGAVTVDWTAGMAYKQAEPTGIITYTFTAPPGPCHLQLLIDSDGTSTAYTHVFPGTVIWMGATWAALANKKSIINFWYDGTNYYATGMNQV